MMTLIKELSNLIQVMEAEIPANPSSPKNQKLAEKFESDLVKYFRSLADAFPFSQIGKLYSKYIKESLGSETMDVLDPILNMLDAALTAKVSGHLLTAHLSATTEMITWGITKKGIPIAYEGPPMEEAIQWANKHGAKLVTRMNEETKRRLARTIKDGIANKRGIPGLSRDIRREFADMSKYRSHLIAKTETRQALFASSRANMIGMGIDGKEWVLGSGGETGNCDDCIANAAVGIISVNEEFPTPEGDIHPGCVLPDTMINPLGMQLMTKALYSGMVVELHTASGNRLTVTPNHPILTPSGFIPAKGLKEGDNIICCLDRDGMVFAINPNYQYMPSRIEDIWNSLVLSSSMAMTSVKPSPIDFHGDAGNFKGNINIIYPHGFLEGDFRNTSLFEHISQQQFNIRDTKPSDFSSFGFSFPFNDRAFTPSSSTISFGSKCLAVPDRHSRHADFTSLAIITDGDSFFDEITANYTPIYLELSSQFKDRFARFITDDKITYIRKDYFSGHVYNLQSLEQLYIANNIVVKNCTCAIAPAIMRK